MFKAENMAAELSIVAMDIAVQLNLLYTLEQAFKQRGFREEVALRMLEGVDRKITMLSGVIWMLEVYFTDKLVDEDDRHSDAARDMLLCGDGACIELWCGGELMIQPLAEISVMIPEDLDAGIHLIEKMNELKKAQCAIEAR